MIRSAVSRASIKRIALYGGIGVFVAGVDFTVLYTLLHEHTTAVFATTLAYVCGVATHFLLNRFLNFRNFERTIVAQARTYTIIVLFAYLVTIAIVEAGIHLGFPPFPLRIFAAIINFPLGYMSHRYLTFGPGIGATIRRGMIFKSQERHD